MPGNEFENRFAQIYNDISAYPTLRDVARGLGKSVKTVRNYSALLRRRTEAGRAVPGLIWRGPASDAPAYALKIDAAPELSSADHAHRRASQLANDVSSLLLASRYPVINPEAMVVRSHMVRRYDRALGDYVEVEGSPRTWLTDTLRVAGVDKPAGRTFLFTGAQNDAPVDQDFWRNLNAYAQWLGAEIVVGPWTYETNWWDENNPASRDYDPVLMPHLCFGQMEIGPDFVFCGEMNTLPTAARPISDLTTYSRGRWAVFPHAKLQLLSIPSTDPHTPAHQIMTTGSVTRPMVIPRKAGVKSLFHHVIGATIVEFDEDGTFFCRQLSADENGSFYDLDVLVKAGEISTGHRALAMTAADIHAAKLDRGNCLTTFGFDPKTQARRSDSLLDTVRPEHLLIHDLHDQESRNHHHEDDVSHNFEMAVRGRESVMGEVQRAVDFLLSIKAPETEIIVVESNHDLALERYVREGRYRMDGVNFRVGLTLDAAYHDWRAEVAKALDGNLPAPTFSLLEWTMRFLAGPKLHHVKWVHDGQSLVIDGVQVGAHGFRGANGAKGTVAGYARLGQKMSIGDKHSPAILDGVYVAGVMQLNHGYNKGPSGWSVTHILQYRNGKRALVTLRNGRFRASRPRISLANPCPAV
ncbi:hypothetical protein [Ancylobacter rudongensis]|uniref:Uncharacterized protein n=1 Tax=Ancylobacter rudongensis TaxID=177413 RepID=A0A1G4URV8_9HYPH|nr:hypothetical protein [Ancylobacter rudongensis]SCW95695.1 hypothetical protein SAMN05660859_0094 [Ancylobacter rudongensis]